VAVLLGVEVVGDKSRNAELEFLGDLVARAGGALGASLTWGSDT